MNGKVIAKELKAKVKGGIPGLSARQLDEHHDVLYAGYVNKTNEIRENVPKADLSLGNATFSQIRELKREEVFAVNGVRLHEGYFESLGGDGAIQGTIQEWIEQDFGSVDTWQAEFRALGLSARGWVVLAYDMEDGRLHNYLCDIHSDGVWSCAPLLVMDVYEHAYFLDYGTARAKYLDVFLGNIDWVAVNLKIENMGLNKVRQKTA